jgi:hypothetical protein
VVAADAAAFADADAAAVMAREKNVPGARDADASRAPAFVSTPSRLLLVPFLRSAGYFVVSIGPNDASCVVWARFRRSRRF